MTGNSLLKVSVIIPVYNGTNYLREAIESVFAQTYRNYELIVIDDGSKDGTWKLIQSYGDRLRGFRKENGGVASALNYGIQQSTGDYIAWLSHDDLFLPSKLERQMDFLRQSSKFKACYTDYYVIDAQGSVIAEMETPWYPRGQAIRALFGRAYINGSTMLVKRVCFDEVGCFSERLRYTQDTEMWLRMSIQLEIGRVAEKLGKQRSHQSQDSRHIEINRTEAQMMYLGVFEKLGVAGLFPELAGSVRDPKVIAKSYTWLGDTMGIKRGWYAFAAEQYARSILLYSSWRNPARLKRVLNVIHCLLRSAYRYCRRSFRLLARKTKPGDSYR
jgi:glycosyltransferase involved in cell wall biosynthesis